MTTFQAIIYAIAQGIGEFLPIGSKTHQFLIPYILDWQAPSGPFLGALSLGSFIALLVFFRHDWASMISCFLQVILFRKRPMTLDERLPLFLGLSTLPLMVSSYYFHNRINEADWSPMIIAGVLAIMTVPLWFFDTMSRKNKGMFDWKLSDALVVGLFQATALFPGWDHLGAALVGALFLNYKRDCALKFAYYSSAPILLYRSWVGLRDVNFHASSPMMDVSWLSFGIGLIVSLLVALLAMGGFTKQMQQKGLGQTLAYRWILAIVVGGAYWIRSRS